MFRMVRILFYHSKKKADKKGRAPIYCRITLNKEFTEFSTGIKVLAREWTGEKIIASTQENVLNNIFLDQLRARLSAFYMERIIQKKPVSAAILRQLVAQNGSGFLFTKLLEEYFTEELPRKKFRPSTVIKHTNLKNNIVEFIRENHLQSLLVDEFDIPMAEKLRSWLYNRLNCTRSHCSRHLRLCREIVRIAVKKGILKSNPLAQVELERDPDKPVVSLTIEEIKKINAYRFASRPLLEVWHVFLFQCYTGLSYGDLHKFELREKNGLAWIFSPQGRNKNNKPYIVPLFPVAKQVLLNYEGKLPVNTNQSYNRILKEIAAIVGIDKCLTTHVARKTFATLKDEEGWELSTIARMMGNTENVLRKHYIDGSERRILGDMERLRIRA